MKICLTTFKSRHLEISLWLTETVYVLLVLGILSCSLSTTVSGTCVHDILRPTRNTSPQHYARSYQLNLKSELRTTKYSTIPPNTTSASYPRYTKVGYQIRYRYLRQKVTPNVRHKRFVLATPQPSTSNDTVSNNGTEIIQTAKNGTRSILPEYEKGPEKGGTHRTNIHNHTETNFSSTTVTSTTVNYKELFKPIRIKLYLDDDHIEYANTSDEYKRLNHSLHLAVLKIEQILSVIPVQGPLLFRRTAEKICRGYWKDPPQPQSRERRCGLVNTKYDGEKCLDGFKIPDDHLAGYLIYGNDPNDPNPVTVLYENGTGIPDADTVIYIHAERTIMCKDKGVIAYATNCQLDQYSRPIAGFANFCPDHLADVLYDRDKLYLTAIHEFFHALGFSKDLFDKFQECYARKINRNEAGKLDDGDTAEVEWVCEGRRKTISFLQNTKHIVTPAVARETRKHLNCTTKQGCPLEDHVVLPLKTSSHWEGRFMQGSIMSPMIGLPHLTVIDKITLGAFEDMGWYHVNYSQTEDLAWGKNAGCDFATKSDCLRSSSPYFCNIRSILRGCHYLHMDQGVCQTNKYLDGCRVYKPYVGSECWRHANETKLTEWKGEVYSRNSRCFISNLASEKSRYVPITAEYRFEGRCYMHRCNDSETLEVKVEGSGWRLCEEGAEIEFEGYKGHLKCPSSTLICGSTFDFTTAPVVSPTSAYPKSDPYCASVKISFPKIDELHAQLDNKDHVPRAAEEAQRKLNMFLKKFVNEIVAVTDINSTRIINPHFVTRNTVEFTLMKNLDWSTLSPKDPKSSLDPGDYSPSEQEDDHHVHHIHYNFKKVSCEDAVRRLLVSVSKGDFKVPVGDEVYKANNMTFETSDEGAEKLHEMLVPPKKNMPTGTMAAAAVGAVCAMMLIAVGMMLYWKSQVTTAVSPAPPSPTSTDVRYHPNNGTTVASSENGSFGQLAFTA